MIRDLLAKVVSGEGLTEDEACETLGLIMDGNATEAQMGALMAALRTKQESVDELTGFAKAMRARSIKVAPTRRPLVDTCGTGGDGLHTFNISTAAAFVVAAAGIAVAKHGNRAVSGLCGSADVLDALGVRIDLPEERIADCIDTIGIGFMFAPHHHPALKHASRARRELGIRTVFNVLGPLSNPAGATRQLVGVFDQDLCGKMAEVLGRLGCERAIVAHGIDGMDEISTVGPTHISQLQQGRVSSDTRIPAEFHLVPATLTRLAGGDTADENAAILRSVLAGEKGPRRDIVAVNAAAGLMLGGIADTWRDGIALAKSLIDSRRAIQVLDDLIAYTQGSAPS